MSKSSKNSREYGPKDRVNKVAREAIEFRLAPVPKWARKAAFKSDEDTEYVHRLRVSCRRADATLAFYAELLDEKPMRKIRKQLKQLRRSAGAARDLDVLCARLESVGFTNLRRILKGISKERCEVQPLLVSAYEKFLASGWEDHCVSILKPLGKTNGTVRFGDFARKQLEARSRDFLQLAMRDLSRIDSLHQLRIAGKKLRYTMELAFNAFDDGFRKTLYSQFVQVQEKLGEINDYATSVVLYDKWSKSQGGDDLQALIKTDTKQMHELARQFREWFHVDRRINLVHQFAQALETEELKLYRPNKAG